MHILIVTTYFKPDITANGILITQIAEELAEMGHDITVITSVPHYSTNSIWEEYQNRLWVRERSGKLDVTRLYLYVPESKTSLVGRLLNYITFNALSTIAVFLAGKPDIVIIPSPPLTNGITGILLRMLRGVPYIYNVQDIYPDVAIRLGVLSNPHLIRFFYRLERIVYRYATGVSVISEGFRQNLLAKDVPASKLHVIPNFVDTDFIRPLPRHNAFSRKHDLDERFVVLFAGNVGLSQGLEYVLSAADMLRDLADLFFLIVGNGAAKARLQESAKALGLENVRFLPFQPHEDVAEMYASADLGLVPLRHGIAQDSVPSKVFSLLGAARPLVAAVDRDSDTWNLVENAQCGYCVEPEDPFALADAIRQVYADRPKAVEMGSNGYAYIQEHFTLSTVALQYDQLFRSIVGDESPATVLSAEPTAVDLDL